MGNVLHDKRTNAAYMDFIKIKVSMHQHPLENVTFFDQTYVSNIVYEGYCDITLWASVVK